MAKFRVKIIQVSRVESEITIEVDADSIEEAIKFQESEDAPNYDSKKWKHSWDLQNETVEAA